ncbi:hypothetical protein [Haloglomus salinum]|uniref:hypothetical protein n=1 Tax=Haloglomus salinum TaxID=2962673 RepID=UPI0020C9CF10|nr:hypothetical protein [Haloglomus salinum]
MKRALVAGLVVLTVLTVNTSAVAAQQGQSPGEVCKSGNISDATLENVCDAYNEQRRIIDEQEQRVDQLRNGSDRVGGGQFSATTKRYLKRIDAWDNRTRSPALVLFRQTAPEPGGETGVYQYVGRGRGTHDFDNDGVKSWKKVPTRRLGQGEFGPVEIDLLYAPAGYDEKHVVNSTGRLSEIARELSSPAGFGAYVNWKEERAASARNAQAGVFGILFVLFGITGTGIAVAEARTQRMRDLLRRYRNEREYDPVKDGTTNPVVALYRAIKRGKKGR